MNKRLSCLTQKKSIETSLGPINGDHLIVIMPYNTSKEKINKTFLNKVIKELQSTEEKPLLLIQVQTFLRLFFETLIEGKSIKIATLSKFCPDISTPDEKQRFSLLTENIEEVIKKSLNELHIPFKNRVAIHDMKKGLVPICFSLLPVITSDQHHHILVLDIQFVMEWTEIAPDEEFEKSCQKFTQSALYILNQHLPIFSSQLRCIVALHHIAFKLNQGYPNFCLEEKEKPLGEAQKMMLIQAQNDIPLLNLAHIFNGMSEKQKQDCRDIFDTFTKIKKLSELNAKIQDVKKNIQEISSLFIKIIYPLYGKSDLFFDTLSEEPQYQSFLFIRTHFSYDTVKKNIEKALEKILKKLFSSLKIAIVLEKKYKQLKHLFDQKCHLINDIDQLEDAVDQLDWESILNQKIKNKTALHPLKLNIKGLNSIVRNTIKLLQVKKVNVRYLNSLEEKLKESKTFLDEFKEYPSSVFKQFSLALPYVIRLINKMAPLQDQTQIKQCLYDELSINNLAQCLKGLSDPKPIQVEFGFQPKETNCTSILTEKFLLENQCFFENLSPNIPIEGISLTHLKSLELQSGQVFMIKKTGSIECKKRKDDTPVYRADTLQIASFGLQRKKSMHSPVEPKPPKGFKDIHIAVFQRQHQKIKEIIQSRQDVFVPVEKGYPDEENTSLDLAIKNGDTKALDILFHHAQQSFVEVSIHEKTKYWIFVKTLISRQWLLSVYFKFEDFFNSVLQELNENPITKETTLVFLFVYHKAKDAMELIKNSLSAQKQKEWTSAIKIITGLYETKSPVFSKKYLSASLSKKTSQDDTLKIQELNDEWIQKILTMTPENLDQIIEKKEDEYLFSTAKETRFESMTFLQLIIYFLSEDLVTVYLKKIQKDKIENKVSEKNSELQTVIHFLALKGFLKTTKRLLFMFKDSVNLLLEDGQKKTPLDFAIQEDQKIFVQEMLEKEMTWSDSKQKDLQITQWVHQAVSQSAKNVLLYFIKIKKDSVFSYNHLGQTPLMSAAKANNLNLLKLLIHHSSIDQYSAYGCTALHIAIQAGAIESAMMLINKGANPQLTDLYARTAFHMAAFKGNLLLMIKIMENKRQCINQCDFFGNTALHHAAYSNYANAVSFLVKHGFDSQKRNMQQGFNPEFMKSIQDDHKALFNIESPLKKYHQSPADMALTQVSCLSYLACFDSEHPCLNESKLKEEMISQRFLSEDIFQKMAEHGFQFLLKEKNLQERERGLNNLLVLLGKHRFLTYGKNMLSLQNCQDLFIEETIFRKDIFFELLMKKITSDKDFFQNLKIIIAKGTPLSLRYFLKHTMLLQYQSDDWNLLIESAIQSQKEEIAIYLAVDPRRKASPLKELGVLALNNDQQHAFVFFLLMGSDVDGEEYLANLWKDQLQLNYPRFFSLMICQLELKKKNDPKADILMRVFEFIIKNEKEYFQKDIESLYSFQDDAGDTIFHYFLKTEIGNYADFMALLLEKEYAHSLFFLENKEQKCALTLLLERSFTHQYWDILKKIFKLTTDDINQMRKNQNKESIKEALLSKKTDLLVGYQQKIKQVFDEINEDTYARKLRDLLQEINPHEILKYIAAYYQNTRPLSDVFFKKAKIALNCLYQETPEVFRKSVKRYPSIPLQHIFEEMVDVGFQKQEHQFFDYLRGLYLFADSVKSHLHQKPILRLLNKSYDLEQEKLIEELLHAFFFQTYKVKAEKEFSKILDVMRELKDVETLNLILKGLEKILKKEEISRDRLDEKIFVILNVTFLFIPIQSAHFLLKNQHKLKKHAFKNFLLTQKTNIVKNIKKIKFPNHILTKRGGHEEGASFSHKASVHEFLAVVEESKLTAEAKAQVCIYVLDNYYENKSQSKKIKKKEFNLNKAVIKLFDQSERGCFKKKGPSIEFLNSLKTATRFYLRSAKERIDQS